MGGIEFEMANILFNSCYLLIGFGSNFVNIQFNLKMKAKSAECSVFNDK